MATYTTLVEAKAHLRVDFTDDDTYIAGLQDMVEQMVLAEISGTYTGEGSVTTAGAVALVGAETNFTDFAVGDVIKVEGETERTINAITTDTALTVSVAFTTSVADLAWEVKTGLPLVGGVLPLGLKQAMLLLIGNFYMLREPVTVGTAALEIPFGYKMLIAPYKNWTVA